MLFCTVPDDSGLDERNFRGPLHGQAIDEMEASFLGSFKRARAELGVTSFGVQVIDFPPNNDLYPEHDHADDGQEEVYLALSGEGELDIEGETHPLTPDVMVRVGPGVKRTIRTGDSRLRLLAMGGTPASLRPVDERAARGARPDGAAGLSRGRLGRPPAVTALTRRSKESDLRPPHALVSAQP